MPRILFGVAIGLLIGAAFFYFHTSPAQHISATESLDQTLSSSLQSDYDKSISDIERKYRAGEISMDEAVRRREQAKGLLAHGKEVATGPVHNCAENFEAENGGSFYRMDLSYCKEGVHIELRLADSLKAVKWHVSLYNYGNAQPSTILEQKAGHQLIAVSAKADVRPLHEDGSDGTTLEVLGGNVFQWRGYTP